MKKSITLKTTLLLSLSIFSFFSCKSNNYKNQNNIENYVKEPRIFLYGEAHGEKVFYDEELKAWQNFYINQNMRHFFLEYGYSTVQLMNQWMKAGDDTLLFQLYENWKGTASYNEYILDFYRSIKQTCPETIFHGIDVGHEFETNDSELLRQMEKKGLTDSPEYQIVLENIEQAKHYYKTHDQTIRENYMAANFIREVDSLPENEKIMGVYGSAHVNNIVDISGRGLSMITQV